MRPGDLTRYWVSGDWLGTYADPDPNGEWVKFEDVENMVQAGADMEPREQRFGCSGTDDGELAGIWYPADIETPAYIFEAADDGDGCIASPHPSRLVPQCSADEVPAP